MPQGWNVIVHPSLTHRGRFKWLVSTRMGFVFAGIKTYASAAGARRSARQKLDRFFGRFGDMV